jgi:hypothetical protein
LIALETVDRSVRHVTDLKGASEPGRKAMAGSRSLMPASCSSLTCCYVFPREILVFHPSLHRYCVSQAEMDQIARIDKLNVSPKLLLHGRCLVPARLDMAFKGTIHASHLVMALGMIGAPVAPSPVADRGCRILR